MAVITRANQELSLAKAFSDKGAEVYAPTRKEFRQRSDRKVRIEVPVVKNLIFVHMPADDAYKFINANYLKVRFMTDCTTRTILIIPDKQMENFRHVLDTCENSVAVTDCFEKGQRVLITEGQLAGTYAEVIRYKEKQTLCVRLYEGLCALVDIPAESLELQLTGKQN